VGLGGIGFHYRRFLNVDQGLVSWPALGQTDFVPFSAARLLRCKCEFTS
jgi:hypothetical protein